MGKKTITKKKNIKTRSKKTTVKKTSPKKAVPKAKSKKAANKKSALIKEFNTLSKKLSEEELAFIVNQTKVIVHNNQVLQDWNKSKKGKNSLNKSNSMLQEIDKSKIEIIEADDGSYFIIAIGRKRNFFSRDEMKKIVKMCHVADNAKDAGARLYSWLDNIRPDVLRDSEIANPGDEGLQNVYKKIVKTYTVNE